MRRILTLFYVVAFISLLGALSYGSMGTSVDRVSTLGPLSFDNIRYCTIQGYPEFLDVSIPDSVVKGLDYPAVVFVHGGGWVNGSKNNVWHNFPSLLTSNDFVFVSLDYYMPNNSLNQTLPGYPLNVEDVACAIRFLRAHAPSYKINPNEIGLAGESAGGQLVSLEAISAINGTFDNVGEWHAYSSKVQAVSDAYGPINLTDSSFARNPQLMSYGKWKINLTDYAFGGVKNLVSASPVSYRSLFQLSRAPPFLIVQGWNDTIVPPIQSIMFYNFLRMSGNEATLIMVKNAGHSLVPVSGAPSPSLSDVMNSMVGFFNGALSSQPTDLAY
jgi:acetyl esterase/lipase